jgi:hypothetical protein
MAKLTRQRRTKSRTAPRRASPQHTPGVGPYPPDFIGPILKRGGSWFLTPEQMAAREAAREAARKDSQLLDQVLASQMGWRLSASSPPASNTNQPAVTTKPLSMKAWLVLAIEQYPQSEGETIKQWCERLHRHMTAAHAIKQVKGVWTSDNIERRRRDPEVSGRPGKKPAKAGK